MKRIHIIFSLVLVASGTICALPVSSADSDLQGYLGDTNAENSKYLTAIKKAGNDQEKITAASKDHVKALEAIRQKHKAGVQEYYKSAYQQDKAKQAAWRAAEADLKKQYASKLGKYWDKMKQIEDAFSDSMKALRAEYARPLKAYETANRNIITKYW